jgi:hypothetical protein
VDSAVPGSQITEEPVANMASVIVEKVQELGKQIMPVLIQLLANNAYE